jgi:hypothetical protein
MIVILCCEPLSPREPDSAFEAEVTAIRQLAIPYGLMNFEDLVNRKSPVEAVRRVSVAASSTAGVYRGWMLTPDQYTGVWSELTAKNIHLINDPDAYRHCHLLPESYPIIEHATPETAWVKKEDLADFDLIRSTVARFGSRPIIIKDYVKSRKHEWSDACFIPSAADATSAERVIRNFLERQGDDLVGGLVVREFTELQPVGRHPVSNMPLSLEYRIFWLDGQPVLTSRYWADDAHYDDPVPVEQFAAIARKVRSRFFTMDVAKTIDGRWIIVELGDAQVSGLPSDTDAPGLYARLHQL